MSRTRVLLVFGGDSSEHQISCLTAAGVLKALDRDRFDVTCVGIVPGGRWVIVPESVVATYAITDGQLPTVSPDFPDAVLLRGADGFDLGVRDGSEVRDVCRIDVAFALLHGPFGEDGTIQGLFEMMGVRYVGAGVLTSALCQDKYAMKLQLVSQGLPVGPFVSVPDALWRTDPASALEQVNTLEYPVFVKPARGGSSIGITRVTDPADVPVAIDLARRHDPMVIVEQGLVGVREVECAVLGGMGAEPATASLPGEIIVHTESKFYDFETKYLPDQPVTLAAPADLPDEVVRQVQTLAVEAFTRLGVEGLARVDTFVLPDGSVVVNELNTMPGFTATSMYPLLWSVSGLDYTSLVSRLLDLALERPLGLR